MFPLQVCLCLWSFQPRKCTGWGSEGVNIYFHYAPKFELWISLSRTVWEVWVCSIWLVIRLLFFQVSQHFRNWCLVSQLESWRAIKLAINMQHALLATGSKNYDNHTPSPPLATVLWLCVKWGCLDIGPESPCGKQRICPFFFSLSCLVLFFVLGVGVFFSLLPGRMNWLGWICMIQFHCLPKWPQRWYLVYVCVYSTCVWKVPQWIYSYWWLKQRSRTA